MLQLIKAFKDLKVQKARAVMIVIAMAVGIAGAGFVLNSYVILKREIQTNYLRTNPASFVLKAESLPSGIAEKLKENPDIGDVEFRTLRTGRLETAPGVWKTAWIFVLPDYQKSTVDKIYPETGSSEPGLDEIIFERAAYPMTGKSLNESIPVKLPGQKTLSLKITGTVHAPGLPPAWMENIVYGYVSPETMARLGNPSGWNEVHAVVRDDPFNRKSILTKAYRAKDMLTSAGFKTDRVEVPAPGKHPHGDQMNSLLFLNQVFGWMALILSSLLAANLIASIMSRQTREIGILKSIGGTPGKIISIYFTMTGIMALAAVVIGLPAAFYAGQAYSTFVAGILNFKILDASVPAAVVLLELAIGIFLPIIVSLPFILRGIRIPPAEALRDTGVDESNSGSVWIDRLTHFFSRIPRPDLLAFRNTFRKKGRLAFSALTLAAGGVFFITAVTVSASLQKTIIKAVGGKNYSVEIDLTKMEKIEDLQKALKDVTGFKSADYRIVLPADIAGKPGLRPIPLVGISIPDNFINLDRISGRKLLPEDTMVLSAVHSLAEIDPAFEIGTGIQLSVSGIESTWRTAGVVREVGTPPKAYIPYSTAARIAGVEACANQIAVDGNLDITGESGFKTRLEKALEKAGIAVEAAETTGDFRKILVDHIQVISVFLISMALLVVIVGVIGLASSMSVSVMERTREIGVMRAVGARPFQIVKIVLIEGIAAGLISWIIAGFAAFPLSGRIGNLFSMIFLHTTLDSSFSVNGWITWLILTLFVTFIAGIIPSVQALRIPASQALRYE